MQSKPLVLRYDIYGIPFASQFLGSDDFDIDCLKLICKQLDVRLSGKKVDLVRYIENSFSNTNQCEIARNIIIPALIKRNRRWIAFKLGKINISKLPQMKDPADLVFEIGNPNTWYGPTWVEEEKAYYYLNFELISHWEFDKGNKEPLARQIRWLRVVRITSDVVSIHWQGFYAAEDSDVVERESQLRYWEHIPKLFDELQQLLSINLTYPSLSQLALDTLWDEYRNKKGFQWEDLRIRAESGGVSLNARSTGSNGENELDITGLKHLARTLSLSVSNEMALALLPDGIEKLQEIILRTLIRQFGAKSYEFSLIGNGEKLIKAHVYFGMKPNFPTADCFPHIHCYTSWQKDRKQFSFILDNLLINNADKLVQSTLV